MRIAFSIVLNGLHHLQHNNYAEYLAQNIDLWIIAEGASKSTGSTSWCKEIPAHLHNNGRSVDGTIEYLQALAEKYKNIRLVTKEGFWNSKDEQVNSCLLNLRPFAKPCFLWEIDADEQWTIETMKEAENELIANNAKTGMFHCNYYVGSNLLAQGDWGEGKLVPYRRLWLWDGELFETHEPPTFKGGNEKELLLPQRFEHYAYFFEKDVMFKESWYSGHEHIYEKWKALQLQTNFPRPINELLGIETWWGRTNTSIIKINKVL